MTLRTPSNALVLQPEHLPAHDRGGGAHTVPLVMPSTGTRHFITGYTTFEPGAQIPFHSHNCEESVVLLEGDAMLDIDGQEYRLKPLDATYIPPDVPHRFRNLSTSQPMKILWIYGDIHATRTLVETGATRPVAAEHVSK